MSEQKSRKNEEIVKDLQNLAKFGRPDFGFSYVITEAQRDEIIQALTRRGPGRPPKTKGRAPE